MNAFINSIINATWGRLSTSIKIIICVGIGLLLIGLIWLYGAKARNHFGNWWHARQVAAAQREIDTAKSDAQRAKAVAEDALKELQAEKQVTAAEKAKREVLEGILADKTLNANQKLKAWESIKDSPIVVTPVSSDTDELCRRAKNLGIECGN